MPNLKMDTNVPADLISFDQRCDEPLYIDGKRKDYDRVHEKISGVLKSVVNFYDIHDGQKKLIRKLRHDIHAGRQTIHRRAEVKNNRCKILCDFEKTNPPVIVKYTDATGAELLNVYFDGKNYFIKTKADSQISQLDIEFKKQLNGETLIFDEESVSLTLSADITLSERLLINAKQFKLGEKAKINTQRAAVRADSIHVNGDICADNMSLLAKRLENNGKISAESRLQTSIGGDIVNHGVIHANGLYLVDCANYINDGKAEIIAQSHCDIKCRDKFENKGAFTGAAYTHIKANKIAQNGMASYVECHLDATAEVSFDKLSSTEIGHFADVRGDRQINCKGSITRFECPEANKTANAPAGIFFDSQTVIMDRAAKIECKRGNGSADEILIHSENDFFCNSTLVAEHVCIESNKSVTTKPGAAIDAGILSIAAKQDIQLNNQGNQVSEMILRANDCTTSEKFSVTATVVNVAAADVKIDGKMTVARADINAVNKVVLKKSSVINSSSTLEVNAPQVDIIGTLNGNAITVTKSDKVTIAVDSDIVGRDVVINSAKNLTVLGSVNATNELVLNSKSVLLDEKCNFDTDNNLTVNAEQITIRKSEINAGGKAALRGENISLAHANVKADMCEMNATAKLQVLPAFHGDINQLTMNCRDGSFHGSLSDSGQVSMNAANNFTIGETADVHFRECVFVKAGNEFNNNGRINYDKDYADDMRSRAESTPYGYLEVNAKNATLNSRATCFSGVVRVNETLNVTEKGHVECAADAIITATDIVNKGEIHARNVAVVKAKEAVKLAPESVLLGRTACTVEAQEAELNGAVIDAGALRIESEKVTLDDFSRIQCKQDLTVASKLYRHDNASVRARNITMELDSFYCKSGTIVADDVVKIDSGNYYNDVDIKAQNIVLTVNDKLETGIHSHVTVDKNLRYKANEIVNRGTNLAHHSLDLDVKTTITNHNDATFVLDIKDKDKSRDGKDEIPEFMRICANSLWNTGKIAGNLDYVIALNRVFVNGFSEWSSLGEAAKGYLGATVEGKNVSIIAAATLCVGGTLITQNNLNISSLVNVIRGLNLCWNINVSSLISIDSGWILPNPAKFGHYLKAVANGNFTEISNAIFTIENAMTAANLLITALKVMAPQVGVGLSIAWNGLLIAQQLPVIIAACKNLYDKGRENIQFRDVIPLIVMCKSVAMQAINTASMAINYSHQFLSADKAFSLPAFEKHFDKKSILNAVSSAAMAMAPGVREDSLVTVGLPRLVVAGTSQTMSLLNFTTPGNTEIAAVVSKNFIAAQMMGHIVAKTLTMEGQYLRLGGHVKANETFISTKVLELIDEMKFEHAYISTEEFNQKADLNLAKSQLHVTGKHTVDAKAALDMKNTGYDAGQTIVDGKVVTDKSSLKAGELEFAQGSSASIVGSEMKIADKLTVSGDLNISQSSVEAKNTVVGAAGKEVIQETYYRGDNFSSTGSAVIDKSDVGFKTMANDEQGKTAISASLVAADQLRMDGKSATTMTGSIVTTNDATLAATASLSMDNAKLDAANNAVLNGTFDGKQAMVTAKNDILVGADARLTINDVGLQADRDIGFQGRADVTGIFDLEAKRNLDTSVASSMAGDTGAVILKSAGGSPTGAITTGTVMIQNESITDYMGLLRGTGIYSQIQPKDMLIYSTAKALTLDTISRKSGISVTGSSITIKGSIYSDKTLAFTSTSGDLIANAGVTGKQGLYFSSAGNLTTGKYNYLSDNQVVFEAKSNYSNNQGTVSGAQTFIKTDGDVRNVGGAIKGSVYLQVDAGGSIYDTCIVRDYRAAYDTMESYQPGQFSGGTGEGYNGVGMVLYAKNKVINDASVMTAVGDVAVYGENGVEASYRSHEYVSYDKTKKSGFLHSKKERTVVVSTQIQQPIIASTNGRVTLYSQNGGVSLTAAQVLSKYGSDIYSNKSVNILDAIVESKVYKDKSSWWGLSKDKDHIRQENSVPTRIANIDPGLTRIHSTSGDVNMRGTVVIAPGTTEISAAGKVNISLSVLNNEEVREHSGISISAFGIPIVGGGSGRPLINSDPTLDHLKQLSESHGAGEAALNSISTLTDMVNTVNAVDDALNYKGNLLSTLAGRYMGNSFQPKVTFGYEHSKSDYKYQTLGEGGIYTNDLEIHAGESVSLNGVPIYVANNMKVDAPVFEQNGIGLQSSFSSRQEAYSLAFTPKTVDVGIAEGKSSMHQTQYAPQQLYVGGNLEVNAHDWSFNNAQIDVGSLSGQVVNLYGVTKTDHFDAKNEFVSLNTNGNVAYQRGKSEAETITAPSTLNVRGDLTNKTFKVENIELTGASITADGVVDLDAKMKIFDVKTYSKSTSEGFAFNVKEVGKMFNAFGDDNQSQYKHILNPDAQPSSRQVSEVRFNKSIESIEQIQHSVVFGKQGVNLTGDIQGNLHTSSPDGVETIRKVLHHYNAEIPIPTRDNLRLFEKAWDITTGNFFPNANNDALYQKIEKLLGVKDKVKAAAEVKTLQFLSDAVYDKDLGKDKAAEKGLVLVGEYDDAATSTHVGVYVDSSTHEAYIAFRGTDGLTSVKTDDMDIFTGAPIGGVSSDSFNTFIDKQINDLEEDGYSIYLTGHSRGASQASVVSSEYDLPAIVFENPGVRNDGTYDFSNVLSFQSSPDIVNSIPDMLPGASYDYGSVWLLPETPQDSFRNIILTVADSIPELAPVVAAVHLETTHGIGYIDDRVDESLKGGSGYVKPMTGYDPYSKINPENLSAENMRQMQAMDSKISVAGPATLFHRQPLLTQQDLQNAYASIPAVALKINAQSYGFNLKDVKGDGWCLFYALIDQLHRKNKCLDITPAMLVQTAITHMRSNRDEYADFYAGNLEAYFMRLKSKKEWPDENVIRALAREMGMTIAIVRSDGKDPTIIKPEDSKVTVYLGYEINRHYQSLLQRMGGMSAKNIETYINNADVDAFKPKILSKKIM